MPGTAQLSVEVWFVLGGPADLDATERRLSSSGAMAGASPGTVRTVTVMSGFISN